MSRQSSAPRPLSLPEELEKLEQSITLTLQEIDSNFSRAHRIVTGSILPIVEQYAKHSSAVWDGSKFWKQFFEASANVSLSGYEDDAHADESTLEATETDASATLQTPTGHDDRATVTDAGAQHSDEEDFSALNSPTQVTGVQTTPRLASASRNPSNSTTKPSASRPTPSTTFRSPSPRKYTGRNPLGTGRSPGPSTPHAAAAVSSPFEPESGFQPSAQPSARRNHNTDPLLHRGVLDKNYRIQATPHTQRRARQPQQTQPQATPATASNPNPRALWEDSPESSPEISAPQLRSELFSPAKQKQTRQPRTPGVSVLTPHRNRSGAAAAQNPTTSTGRALFSTTTTTTTTTSKTNPNPNPNTPGTGRASYLPYPSSSDSDSDSADAYGGMSPPKTMQFHVPQSRLVQTPAREASRKIVQDLLATAGAGEEAEEEEEEDGIDYGLGGDGYREDGEEEESPSVVRRGFDVDEDTF